MGKWKVLGTRPLRRDQQALPQDFSLLLSPQEAPPPELCEQPVKARSPLSVDRGDTGVHGVTGEQAELFILPVLVIKYVTETIQGKGGSSRFTEGTVHPVRVCCSETRCPRSSPPSWWILKQRRDWKEAGPVSNCQRTTP